MYIDAVTPIGSPIGFMLLQAFEAGVGLAVLGLAARRWMAATRPLRHAPL